MYGTYGFFALMMLFTLLCLAAMGLNHQARTLHPASAQSALFACCAMRLSSPNLCRGLFAS